MLKAQARLAESIGMEPEQIAIVENGRVISFNHGEMTIGERIPGGYVFVDGSGVGNTDQSTIRQREQLGNDGVIVLNLVLDAKDNAFRELKIQSRGFMTEEDSEPLFSELRSRVERLALSPSNNLERDLHNTARNLIYDDTRRQPVIFASVFHG